MNRKYADCFKVCIVSYLQNSFVGYFIKQVDIMAKLMYTVDS